MIGKWHLGNGSPRYLPTARGFDYFFGYLGSSEYYWSKRPSGDDYVMFHDFMYADTDCYYGYDGDDFKHYSTHLYQDAAVSVINNHDYDSSPLFLYMAFQAVHEPFIDDRDKYSNGIPKDYLSGEVYNYIKSTFPGTTEQQYYMALGVVDGAIEEIYTAVDSAGQLDNTYFMLASDNGGCAKAGGRNYPLRGQKGSLFEGGTKVEAFVYSPLISEDLRGTTYGGLFHVSDWFPTILDMAQIEYTAKKVRCCTVYRLLDVLLQMSL
jgi:arylsulfatase A-like enzyme